jgi:hypothetical protein
MRRSNQFYKSFFLLLVVSSLLFACREITYNVPENKHLLDDNTLVVEGNEDLKPEIFEVIRQKSNLEIPGLGIKLRLRVYNRIDSTKAEVQQQKRVDHYRKVNNRLAAKDHKINSRRIAKAEKKFPKVLQKNQKENAQRKKKAQKVNNRRKGKVDKKNQKLLAKQLKYKDSKKHRWLKSKRPHVYIPYVPVLKDTVPVYRKKNRVLRNYKDTTDIKPKLKKRLKYKFGEAPAIADSALMNKSLQQFQAYLRSKGYYNGIVSAHFDTIYKTKKGQKVGTKKVVGSYYVQTGERFIIDSVLLKCPPELLGDFNAFVKKIEDANDLNSQFKLGLFESKRVYIPYDANQLDAYRYEVASYMLDHKFYGFSEQNVYYKVDTMLTHNSADYRMTLTIGLTNRFIEDAQKKVYQVPFRQTMVEGVHFHISDTTYYENYSKKMDSLNIDFSTEKYLPTLDKDYYDVLLRKAENHQDGDDKKRTYYKSTVNKNLFGNYKDSIEVNPFRLANFYFNGEMFVSEALIECQNYLENTNYYKEYYIDRSYTSLQQLGIFSQVDYKIIEKNPGNGKIEVHYYLAPATRQSFSFQPKATNVNGFFGISASLNYTNINLLRTGTKMNFSIGSGFEQNSTIIQDPDEDAPFFNTIEFGPSLKFDIPGLFPVPVTALGKRQKPRTELAVSLNYQERVDFKRTLVQTDWNYKFSAGDGKTQSFVIGTIAPVIKIVSISKTDEFTQRIEELNDLFLKNAYSDQLIWQDFKFGWTVDNLRKDDKKFRRLRATFNFTLNTAGNVVAPILAGKNPEYDDQGHRLLYGLPYSQFRIIDFKYIANIRFNRKHSFAFRAMYGHGWPGKNSSTSLPYDYSFSSGGANDVRGWEARQLGPGTYLSLLDPNAVATQIGDVRLQSSLEYRFGGGGVLNHAFFADGGNIWTVNYDALRPGSQLTKDFYKQIAFNLGYGLRLDFSFFIFRIDVGVPIFNPSLPGDSKWIFNKHTEYHDLATQIYGDNYKEVLNKFQINPFRPHIHFGIGLPF